MDTVYCDSTNPAALERIVGKLDDLPTFPEAGLKLLKAFSGANYNAKKLGEIIASDVSMSVRVLRSINSAFYGLSNQISSVPHAVSLLGMAEIENLTMNICLLNVADKVRRRKNSFDPNQYIKHSMFVGRVAQHLASVLSFQMVSPGEAYTAGLLHDVGVYLLYRNYSEDMQTAIEEAERLEISYDETELANFEVTHAALGSWMTQQWKLPPSLYEAIAYHHCDVPQECLVPELAALLKLSEMIALTMDVGNTVEGRAQMLDQHSRQLLTRCGLPAESEAMISMVLAKHGEKIQELLDELEQMLEGKPRSEVSSIEVAGEAPAPKTATQRFEPQKKEGFFSKLKRMFSS
jgi:putative nucleotidyltransferase with HDIG domain